MAEFHPAERGKQSLSVTLLSCLLQVKPSRKAGRHATPHVPVETANAGGY